jgi:nucleoside-diphosphate-sugar epimerase
MDTPTQNSAKHIVIGTGPLGRATANALVNLGQDVVLVNRSGKLDALPQGATIASGDLGKPESLGHLHGETSAVYFCAQPPYHRWVEEFPALQKTVIDFAELVEAPLIVAENLYGYGPVTSPMTEDMPLKPNTRKGSVRAAMHESLMEAHHAGRVKVAVARGSDFFGPYVDGSAAGARAFAAITKGKAVEYIGDPDVPHSYTFVSDFGKALAILGTNPKALGQVWHVPNAPTVSSRVFFEKAFKLAGNVSKFRRISTFEMHFLGLFIKPLKEMCEMVYEFEKPFVVNHNKFKVSFGDISTPLDVALSETIAWTRKNKSIG